MTARFQMLLLALVLAGRAAAADGERPVIAVAPFCNHTRGRSAGIEAADFFIRSLFKADRYTIVHPVEAIKRLMGYRRGCLGVDEIEAAQRIGKGLRCDAVLIGDVRTLVGLVEAEDSPAGRDESLVEVSARLVDVGSAETLWLSHYTVKSLSKDPLFNRLGTAVASWSSRS